MVSKDPGEIITALSALAHPHRLAVFRLLVEAGPAGCAAGAIALQLELAPSSLSFHLQHLRRARLVTPLRRSRQLLYSANFDSMQRLISYLTENCCTGDASACGGEAVLLRPARKPARKRARAA